MRGSDRRKRFARTNGERSTCPSERSLTVRACSTVGPKTHACLKIGDGIDGSLPARKVFGGNGKRQKTIGTDVGFPHDYSWQTD